MARPGHKEREEDRAKMAFVCTGLIIATYIIVWAIELVVGLFK